MATCDQVAQVAPPTPQGCGKTEGRSASRKSPHSLRRRAARSGGPRRIPTGLVMYAVEEVNAHGRSAGLSNQVAVPVVPTIAPPDKLSAEVTVDAVQVSWSGPQPPAPPKGVTYQYRIMRRPVGAPAYIVLDDVRSVGHRLVSRQDLWLGAEIRVPHHHAEPGAARRHERSRWKARIRRRSRSSRATSIRRRNPPVCRRCSPASGRSRSSISPGRPTWTAILPDTTSIAGSRAASRRS